MSTFLNDPTQKPMLLWPDWCRFATVNGRPAKLVSVGPDHVQFQAEVAGNGRSVVVSYEALANETGT